MQLHELITELCSLPAPSGFEEKAFERLSELLSPYVDEICSDAIGNLIAVKRCNKPHAKSLMLNAHMDEVGLIVTGHEKGFLRFSNLGGIDSRMLPARELKILTEPPSYGVIDTMPPHTLSNEDKEKSIDAKKLFIDIGMSQDEAVKRVPLGTPAVFLGGCDRFADNHICGKSLDDRACVAILVKTMEALANAELSADIYLLISTQEELGMRGAVTGTFGIEPDYAVTVDVTHAATPDSKKGQTMEMGKGPAIGIGPNMDRKLTQRLLNIAKDKRISYQSEVMGGCTGTDGWVIQVSRTGVAVALASLPIKYMHSPVELMDLADAQDLVSLLTELAVSFGEE